MLESKDGMFFLGVVVIVCILKYPFNYKNDDKNYPILEEKKFFIISIQVSGGEGEITFTLFLT